MHLLGDFIYNNIKYSIYIANKKFTFSKTLNNEEIFNLSEEEHNLIKEVLTQILPTGNIIKLNDISYNHHKYNHYLDITNDLHYFYGENNDLEDLKELCYLYNNEEEYVCDKHLDKEQIKKKRYQRLVKANKILISLNISLIAFLSIVPKINPNINKYINNPINLAIRALDDRVMTLEKVYEYLDENPYLSEKEKAYIHNYEDFIITELPYTNYQDLKENLLNMHTCYHDEEYKYRGSWTYFGKNKYTIDIYYSKNIDLEEIDQATFSHEVLHSFTVNYAHTPKYMSPFYEFVNMVLNNEYSPVSKEDYYSYDYSYYSISSEGYALMELFNPDTLRKFHAECNGNILLDELEKIIPDRKLGIRLFNDLNDYFNMISSNNYSNEEMYDVEMDFKNIINQYYLAKCNQNVSANIYMSYLLDFNPIIQRLSATYKDYIVEFQCVDRKYYFNTKRTVGNEFKLTLKSPETKEIVQEISLDDTARVDDLFNIFARTIK